MFGFFILCLFWYLPSGGQGIKSWRLLAVLVEVFWTKKRVLLISEHDYLVSLTVVHETMRRSK